MESAERRPDPARETGQSTRQKGPERAMEQGVEARTNVRNQQVAGSSPASSSTKPRVSAEIRGFVRQKRSKTFRSDITEKTHEFRPPALA